MLLTRVVLVASVQNKVRVCMSPRIDMNIMFMSILAGKATIVNDHDNVTLKPRNNQVFYKPFGMQ